MYLKNYVALTEHLKEKKERFLVRVTTQITGSLKNEFIEDCLLRETHEAKMAKDVFDVYYTIIKENPNLKGKEIKDIKTYVIGKLRL